MAHLTCSPYKIALVGAVMALCLGGATIALPQNKPKDTNQESKTLAKRCNPVVVKNLKVKEHPIRIRKGEKRSGFDPLIAFEITESGEVINAHVTRSSGIKDIDDYALNSIKATRYSSRPGCPIIESEGTVTIDFL